METKLNKISRWFLVSAGVLLALTGLAKIASAFGKSAIIAKPDPIFGISFIHLLFLVGMIEVVISFLCLTSANQKLTLGLVAVLSVNFLGYRTGLWLIHWQGYCPCLGTLTRAIHLSPHRADLFTGLILMYLTLGSLFFLACSCWWDLKERRACGLDRSITAVISGSSSYMAKGSAEIRDGTTSKTCT